MDDRLGEHQVLQLNRLGGVAQGITGGDLFEADRSDDVARADGVEVLAVVRVHQQQTAQALLLGAPGRIDDGVTLVQGARIDAQEGQLTHKGVGHDLKGQRGEGLGVVGLAEHLVLLARLGAVRRRQVDRRGQVVHDRIEHGLNTLVLEGRAIEDRYAVATQGATSQRGVQAVGRRHLVVQDRLHQLVVEGGQDVDQSGVVVHGLSLVLVGNRHDFELLTLVVVVDRRVHGHDVDDAQVVALGADRQLDDGRYAVQTVSDHVHAMKEVRTGAVHLVDEADARHVVLIGLAPDRLGLGLNARHGVKDRDGTVQDAK